MRLPFLQSFPVEQTEFPWLTSLLSTCREVIANKSKAAAGLCDWAINIVKYFDVVAEVEPKRAELAAANGKLNDANATLKTVQDKVAGLNAQVRSLEEAYSKVFFNSPF